MEDEEESDLQICSGDWCLFSLFVVFLAFPSLFFCVRRFVGPQFPHRQLFCPYGRPTPQHALDHIHAHSNTYFAIVSKET